MTKTMNKAKYLLAFLAAAVLAVALAAPAWAATQTVTQATADADNATITVNNPARGETYTIYKLFDATVSADGKIAYQASAIPAGLEGFFAVDANGVVTPKDAILEKDADNKVTGTKMTEELKAALTAWAKSNAAAQVATAVSDGSEALEFIGLPYGYYVMTTSHKSDAAEGAEAKSAITVTSTQPNATINDKNVNEPSADKTADKQTYSIGDTITYTATFDTTNYVGEGDGAKQVVDYVISDTLPEYLSNVHVESVTIDGAALETVPQFDAAKKITIPWATQNADNTFTSNYKQGAKIVIVYTAKLTSVTNINAADKNTISINPVVDGNNHEKQPWDESWNDSAEITTYAAAINKVDENGDPLAGATFTFKGLTVTGENGIYTVVSYDPNGAESAPLATDENGKLYIMGLASDASVTVTEATAPNGYNKLDASQTLTPQVLTKAVHTESGTKNYDADGNLVSQSSTSTTATEVVKNLGDLDTNSLKIENQSGAVLPSTGGMGTTILYIVGGIMVLVAVVFLITKRRVKSGRGGDDLM